MANEYEDLDSRPATGRGHSTDSRGDPQITAVGVTKQSARGEIIMFSFDMALLTIMCIVQIPEEGTSSAPVYIKFKLRR